MADDQKPDDSGWRVLFAPFGNLLLVGLLLYKLISLIVDMIDKRIHPENYKSEKKMVKQEGQTIGTIGKMPQNPVPEVKKNNE
jgi:hypothetical protein